MRTQNIGSVILEEVKTTTSADVIMETVIKAVLNRMPQKSKLRHWLRSLAFHGALTRAYASFARHHPRWVDSYFDEYFVQHKAASLLEQNLQHKSLATPEELANLWADQFPPNHPAKKYITALTPVAADFLRWLDVELKQHSLFQEI